MSVQMEDHEIKQRLRDLSREMRLAASRVGPMHSFWDVITDVECFIAEKPTLLRKTGPEWIAVCERMLAPTQPDTKGKE